MVGTYFGINGEEMSYTAIKGYMTFSIDNLKGLQHPPSENIFRKNPQENEG